MGGPGSGHYCRWSSKQLVESCLVLDANHLTREGLLGEGIRATRGLAWRDARSGEKTSSIGFAVDTVDRLHVTLRYTITGSREELEYGVGLETTTPNFGGLRWWFTCPLRTNGRSCWRRCSKLYLPPGGKYYGCRVCYDLAYESQRETRSERMLRRAAKICAKLGASTLYPEFPPEKPKGMHWSTFSRLACEERWLRDNAWAVFARERGLLGRADVSDDLERFSR